MNAVVIYRKDGSSLLAEKVVLLADDKTYKNAVDVQEQFKDEPWYGGWDFLDNGRTMFESDLPREINITVKVPGNISEEQVTEVIRELRYRNWQT